MASSTLFAGSLLNRRKSGGMLVDDPRIDLLPDGLPGPRRFKVKAADAEVRRGLVEGLLKARYGWRGYTQVGLPTDQSVHRFTLAAIEDTNTIGTITVSFDGPLGMAADNTFGPEVALLRERGRKLCEFTKLAIDPTTGSKRVLAALFHTAYIVAHRIRGFDTLLIEVNPRHARYYQRMLGCHIISEERMNKSVKAPAVLLAIDFAYVMQKIGEFAGQPERADEERSLYPFAFTLSEEAAIITRMKARQDLWDVQNTDPRHHPPANPSEFQPSDLMAP